MQAPSTLYMKGGVIKDNTTSSSGGVLFGAGTISGGEITNNQANNYGGVISLTENNRLLTITGDVKIYNNRANYGGAISLAGGTVQISGGEISHNQAYIYGGGVYVWTTNTLNPEIIIEKGAVISDNQAPGSGTIPGGQDLYVAATLKVNNNGKFTYFTPVVSLAAADQLKAQDGTPGIAWYDETTDERNTQGLELDATERTKVYRYTFLYSEPETEMVARLDDLAEFPTVQAAVDAAGDGQLHRITLLKEDKEAVTIPKGTRICFDLNGNTIRGSWKTNTPVFTVKGEMTLEDTSEDQTGCITGGVSARYGFGGGIFVQHGSLVMNSGTLKANGSGSVLVMDRDSSFVMNGGLITKNTQSAVAVNAGSFTMTGGKITGNSANQGTGVYGWAGAKIRIEGGEIIGNTANQGAGLYVQGRLDITGGRICDNKASNYGGGIYLWNGTCNMSGGEISGNTTTNASSNWGGGGIFCQGPPYM